MDSHAFLARSSRESQRLRRAASFAAICLLTFIASTAGAQTFDTCDGGNACSCSELNSEEYDDCNEFGESDLVDVSDPSNVREAYAIESSYDSETGIHSVSAQVTVPVTKVLRVHPNRGNWDDVAELETYFTEAFGLSPALDFSEGHHLDVQMTGAYGRFDPEDDDWADYQSGDLFIDLATGPGGQLSIAGELAGSGDPDESNCVIDKSDEDLRASQCSDYYVYDGPGFTPDPVVTRIFDIERRTDFFVNTLARIDPDGGVSGNIGFIWADVFVDKITLEMTLYNESGDVTRHAENCDPKVKTDDNNISCSAEVDNGGACGEGDVIVENSYHVPMDTAVGSAVDNNSCPAP